MDIYSPEKRSALMRSVRVSNTAPERAVKSALRSLGVAYTSKSGNLPGRPDVVLPDNHAALFVHGCFWHQHKGCCKSKLPAANPKFWREKLTENVRRDRRHAAALRRAGWMVRVVWECETCGAQLPGRLSRLLGVSIEH